MKIESLQEAKNARNYFKLKIEKANLEISLAEDRKVHLYDMIDRLETLIEMIEREQEKEEGDTNGQ